MLASFWMGSASSPWPTASCRSTPPKALPTTTGRRPVGRVHGVEQGQRPARRLLRHLLGVVLEQLPAGVAAARVRPGLHAAVPARHHLGARGGCACGRRRRRGRPSRTPRSGGASRRSRCAPARPPRRPRGRARRTLAAGRPCGAASTSSGGVADLVARPESTAPGARPARARRRAPPRRPRRRLAAGPPRRGRRRARSRSSRRARRARTRRARGRPAGAPRGGRRARSRSRGAPRRTARPCRRRARARARAPPRQLGLDERHSRPATSLSISSARLMMRSWPRASGWTRRA